MRRAITMTTYSKKYGPIRIEREYLHYVALDSQGKTVCTGDTQLEIINDLREEDIEYENSKEDDTQ